MNIKCYIIIIKYQLILNSKIKYIMQPLLLERMCQT